MVIYVDLVFLINLVFDFLLLLTVNLALKRYKKIRRIFLGALIGSISLIGLFVPLSAFSLFILKIIMGILMVIGAFGYYNFKYTFSNFCYLFMCSIILGGFLYFLKLEFSEQQSGLVFYYEGLTINYVFLLFIAPLILYVFYKSCQVLREIKNYYYRVQIIFSDNYTLNLTAFLDSGNKLKDPVTNKPIILINKKLIKGYIKIRSPMYVPYNSLNNHGLLECLKIKGIRINDQFLSNYLVGLSENQFNLNGIDCLLNYQVWEDLCLKK